MRSCLETDALSLDEAKLDEGASLIQCDWHPYKEEKSGDRHIQGARHVTLRDAKGKTREAKECRKTASKPSGVTEGPGADSALRPIKKSYICSFFDLELLAFRTEKK